MKKQLIIELTVTSLLLFAACSRDNSTPVVENSEPTEVVTDLANYDYDDNQNITGQEDASYAGFLTDHVPEQYYSFGDTVVTEFFTITLADEPMFRVFSTDLMNPRVVETIKDESANDFFTRMARNSIAEGRSIITLPLVITDLVELDITQQSFFIYVEVAANPMGDRFRFRQEIGPLLYVGGVVELDNFHPIWSKKGRTYTISFWDDGDGYYFLTFGNPSIGLEYRNLVFRIER